MAADVYFVNMRALEKRSLLEKVDDLFERAGFPALIGKGDLVAVKVHFGERGNTAYLRPIFVRRVVDKIKTCGGKPFLLDTNTLYTGSRWNAVDHLQTAIENGFTYEVVGAPLVIADGLTGKDYISVSIDGKHFKEVKIGSAACHADCLIALSHFKGHEMTGFGGTLKNLGMGLGCRSAKQMMHSDVLPVVDEKVCVGCGKCLKWCPAGAISLLGSGKAKKARIDSEKCWGCGECTVTCPHSAIAISWKAEPENLQEKIVEHVLGVLKEKRGKAGFMNFLMDISPDCDCWEWSDAPIVADVGILASLDPVAIDQAGVDLINRAQGIKGTKLGEPGSGDKFRSLYPAVDWSIQFRYGEEIGLGTRKYNLIEIG